MKDIFISKVLPIISVVLLLASLFLFLKMKENEEGIALESELVKNKEQTALITCQSTDADYKRMKEITRHYYNASPIVKAMKETIEITQQMEIRLRDIFKANSPSLDIEVGNTISNYQNGIYTLLDTFEKSVPLVNHEEIQLIKTALYIDTITLSNPFINYQKTTIFNKINANAVHLSRFFSSRIGGPSITYFKLYPFVSHTSVSPNAETFKIYLCCQLPQPKPLAQSVQIYANNKPILDNHYSETFKVPVQDSSTQQVVLSTNWEGSTSPNTDTVLMMNLLDTFSLTPQFN